MTDRPSGIVLLAGEQHVGSIRRRQFNWQDPLYGRQLSEEERMVRDTARQYAQNKLLPRVKNAYRNEKPIRQFSVRWASSGCWAR